MTKVLAVDWGMKRVGVAVSDPDGILARSLPTLTVRGRADAVEQLSDLARREGVRLILLGLPLHLSGEEGESARRVRRLGEELMELGFDVRYRDERLTSEAARDRLRERGETDPEPGRIDAVSAALLLQEFLDEGGSTLADPPARA